MSDQSSMQKIQLPRYRCHKEVEAVKIDELWPSMSSDGGMTIVPADNVCALFAVSAAYVKKHDPKVGGWWVRYRDGYQSWSPASEFEDGYTRIEE